MCDEPQPEEYRLVASYLADPFLRHRLSLTPAVTVCGLPNISHRWTDVFADAALPQNFEGVYPFAM